MVENFTQYWEEKKDILENVVPKNIAHMIWVDAVNLIGNKLVIETLKKELLNT